MLSEVEEPVDTTIGMPSKEARAKFEKEWCEDEPKPLKQKKGKPELVPYPFGHGNNEVISNSRMGGTAEYAQVESARAFNPQFWEKEHI
mmetsp:Transcript_14773/g.25134  ORF Transcript_14773/g.25134 Transcript_14773/m.25134 type:complete len:89 (+) Transcript_14773:388-654(+)